MELKKMRRFMLSGALALFFGAMGIMYFRIYDAIFAIVVLAFAIVGLVVGAEIAKHQE